MAEKTTASVKLPTLEELLHAGAHFGHRVSRWNPKMEKFIYTQRNGVHIIDLVATLKSLSVALDKLQEAADQGSILLVGTKGQAASMVEKLAKERGAFYVSNRWPGGLFTNFKMINKSVSNLIKMEEQLAAGAEGLVKKEELMLARDVERLNRLYEGIKFMDKLPSMVIVIDSRLEKNAIAEANRAGIPVVGLVDTNCNPDLVTYPVPANDDSIKSIQLFLELFGEAIAKGSRSERVIALRRDHEAKLAQMKSEHEQKEAHEEQMRQAEIERLKRLRSGGEIESEAAPERATVVRVVKSSDDAPAKPAKAEAKAEKSEAKSASESAKVSGSDLSSLGLTTRTENALQESGITSIDQLRDMSKEQLMEIKGVGEKAVDEILKAVK